MPVPEELSSSAQGIAVAVAVVSLLALVEQKSSAMFYDAASA